MCKACLAKHFNVSAELLDEKIKMYIMQGCTLFSESEIDLEDHNA